VDVEQGTGGDRAGSARNRTAAGGNRPTFVVGLVAAAAGVLFAANAQLARNPMVSVRQPQNLAQLVAAGSQRVTQLTDQVAELGAEVEALANAVPEPIVIENAHTVETETTAIGFAPVTGPGVTVILDDAPASAETIPGVTPDDLVIHQQDLQAVIAALWAGGAEAMTLMGERVTMTSAFRCTGNVLLLHGRVFSPPFVVEAIGNPQALYESVLASEGVQNFILYADWFGLGFSLSAAESLAFPAYQGSGSLAFAALPPGQNPFRTG